MPSSLQETESVSIMMQRIKQLEEELARAKSSNQPAATANPALMSPMPSLKTAKKPTLKDLDFNIFTKKSNVSESGELLYGILASGWNEGL